MAIDMNGRSLIFAQNTFAHSQECWIKCMMNISVSILIVLIETILQCPNLDHSQCFVGVLENNATPLNHIHLINVCPHTFQRQLRSVSLWMYVFFFGVRLFDISHEHIHQQLSHTQYAYSIQHTHMHAYATHMHTRDTHTLYICSQWNYEKCCPRR